MKLLTVTIPCYNSQDYMAKAIESALQGGDDVEILVVDDGSKDDTLSIAQQYESKYPHIVRAIHKENGGLSDARNAGMKVMTGAYVSYIDSDDWIEENMYQMMMNAIKTYKADICECAFEKTSGSVKKEDQKNDDKVSIMDKRSALMAVVEEKIQPVVWNKLYKREVVKDLWFEVGKYNEDEFFTYKAIERADKIIQISDIGYYYFFREDSIINETYTIRRLDGLEARYERMKYLGKYPEIYRVAKRQLIFMCMYHYQKGMRYLSGKELEDLKKRVKEIYRDIPIDKTDIRKYSSKEKIWYYISKISLEFTCKLRNRFGYGVE